VQASDILGKKRVDGYRLAAFFCLLDADKIDMSVIFITTFYLTA
jgi:hypothetical protein